MYYRFLLLHFKKFDWLIVAVVICFAFFSLSSLFSIGQHNPLFFFQRQLLFFIVGFILMSGLSFFDYRIFKNYPAFLVAIYLLVIFLLLALLLVVYKIKGSFGWFTFGRFSFDPVEFAKLAIILILAKYFSIRHIELFKKRHLIISFLYVSLPLFLVLLQPDLGSASILVLIWLSVVSISGIKARHLIAIILISLMLFGAMWLAFLKDYQKKRILTFLNPKRDPLGHSYNLRQSLITIGSGKIFGKGFGHGSQSQLKFLPEAHTDFIFSVIAEERGFIGVSVLFFLFAVFIYRILKIGIMSNDNFSRLFSLGFAIMVFIQIVINAGMCMGLMPIVGIPLPFISYGGSSMIMNFLGLGILQSIKVRS